MYFLVFYFIMIFNFFCEKTIFCCQTSTQNIAAFFDLSVFAEFILMSEKKRLPFE